MKYLWTLLTLVKMVMIIHICSEDMIELISEFLST